MYKTQINHFLTIINPDYSRSNNKSAVTISSEYCLISGYASVYNLLDQDHDIIAPGAFQYSITKGKVKLLWQHDPAKPIGNINALSEDNYGLRMEAALNNKIQFGSEAIELLKQGAVSGLSVGFIIKDAKYNQLSHRIITKADLMEISIVTFPANEMAQISYISASKTASYLPQSKILCSALKKLNHTLTRVSL